MALFLLMSQGSGVLRRSLLQVVQQVQAAASELMILKLELFKRYLENCLDDSSKTGSYEGLLHEVIQIMWTRDKRDRNGMGARYDKIYSLV